MPISSARARVLLWDGEQVDAFYEGRPVPQLPSQDSADDLLDRHEAAAPAGVEPRTWDLYENLPGMRPRPAPVDPAEIGGIAVEHRRRGDILDWLKERPGPGTSPRRPNGRRNRLPLGQISTRAAEILRTSPSSPWLKPVTLLSANSSNNSQN